MIFPWFLLVMGVAIPFSGASGAARGITRAAYILKVVRRAAILVALGLLVDSSVSRRLFLGLGVLQLLGLAYLIGALAGRLPAWIRLSIAGAFLLAHWALVKFVPFAGADAGTFEESLNVIRHLNTTYLARYHLSGLVSAVPTSALVLLGTLAGDILRDRSSSHRTRIGKLVLAGTVLAFAGWFWRHDLPFNKPVWTASYVLLAGGLGMVLLGFFYLAFDLLPLRPLAFPLVVFGSNAIVVYVAAILFKVQILQVWQHPSQGRLVSLERAILDALGARFGAVPGGWIYTIGFMLCWWLVLLYLHHRRIFIRV
jgi:predicted acyltransferase